MIDDVLRREGGYVNHPKDRGGPTKYGITQANLDAWLASQASVRRIHEDTARLIYRRNYYLAPKIDQLPPALQPFLFDCAVNHGPSRAVKFLQRACEAKPDGRIGPATLAQVDKYAPEGLIRAMIDLRRNFYLNIVRNDPSQKVFLRGWLNRLAEFEAAPHV